MADADPQDRPSLLERLRAGHPWLDHLICAAQRYQSQRGDYYAAGITYFSVLALFPLLMVAFAVAGFVLNGHVDLLDEVRRNVTKNVPGSMGQSINELIDSAIDSRTTVGVIGLVAGLYAGLGWMGNLRAALTAQWEQQRKSPGFLRTKVSDLGALAGLGVALLISLGVSALGSGTIARRVLHEIGLANAPGVGVGLTVLSVVVAVAASWALFTWVIARLPREPVAFRSAVRAAFAAAVVFEILKRLGAFYLEKVLSGPAGVAFGPILGLMVFAYLTARIVLLCTAWAATSAESMRMAVVPPPPPAVISPVVASDPPHPTLTRLAWLGAGALAASGLSRLWRRP
ncbi:inner membrane protein YhjD [Speluncibacter jeojiensis]|uniref:Inner membrane protein YhjD n=1 Tax=Speluncibacter jeojiensis TaxID=2710754 RepID=A0A9X4M3S4_9ACTN|nr:inner membrane protein YhjD [Rhodococcus sp. D2-41]MDG3016510.1 inner membrane protein YhjD [Corynebacteriales bacterium D3-21]